jgi:hypothetical protein
MIESNPTQQKALRTISEVAKRPNYFSQFYGMHGVERFHLAGLELNLLQRLNSLALPFPSDDSRMLTIALQKWHRTHDTLLSIGLRKYPDLFSQSALAVADANLPASSSIALGTPKQSTSMSLSQSGQELGDHLPADVTIPSTTRYKSIAIGRHDSMVRSYSRTIVRIFAAGSFLSAGGLLTATTGIFLGEFFVTYFGVGLVAAGLSTVTLTLFQAADTAPSS